MSSDPGVFIRPMEEIFGSSESFTIRSKLGVTQNVFSIKPQLSGLYKGIDKIIRIAVEIHSFSWCLVCLLKKHDVYGACIIWLISWLALYVPIWKNLIMKGYTIYQITRSEDEKNSFVEIEHISFNNLYTCYHYIPIVSI